MDRRDVIAVPVLLVLAVVLTWMDDHWGWSEDELFLAASAAMIVAGTLLWHFDWSRFRRRSKRAEHL